MKRWGCGYPEQHRHDSGPEGWTHCPLGAPARKEILRAQRDSREAGDGRAGQRSAVTVKRRRELIGNGKTQHFCGEIF